MMVITLRKKAAHLLLLPTLLLILAVPALAASAQRSYSTPEKATEGLIAALKKGNSQEILAIFGPGSKEIASSGDPVADKENREQFLKLYEEKHAFQQKGNKATFSVGSQDLPFPVPLVKKGSRWVFDTKAGKEELLNRRIGRNELEVIDVLNAYVDAQHEYAALDPNDTGKVEFAQKIRSTPGKKDGLYWPVNEGEEESPFGPMAAEATREGYGKLKSEIIPFHGYYFKILKAQGKHAPGGAFNYVVNGKMALGFGLLAYPAKYGSSGIMTFIVNQEGIVHQKNLGKQTAQQAAAITAYDPDQSWKKAE